VRDIAILRSSLTSLKDAPPYLLRLRSGHRLISNDVKGENTYLITDITRAYGHYLRQVLFIIQYHIIYMCLICCK
jgi:hypothetical protein